jgi:hypothetical protein
VGTAKLECPDVFVVVVVVVNLPSFPQIIDYEDF